jgi:hypothetical protein
MTFIQPFILYGLPLISLPLIIHFVNRIRHRSMPWAAMRFLALARRSSTKFARLRQFLILLFRVLAVLCLVLAVARPLLGGWLGFMFAGPPDTVFILLDRSASMETRSVDSGPVKRERAANLLADAARSLGAVPHYIMLDSATRTTTAIPTHELLNDPLLIGPTDAAADITAMLQATLEEIVNSATGTTEIWLASDLQASNWQPDSTRWPELMARFQALPQNISFRLLAMPEQPLSNVAVNVRDVSRHDSVDKAWIELTIELRTSQPDGRRLPLTIVADGIQDEIAVSLDSARLSVRHVIYLKSGSPAGGGQVAIPADQGLADNVSFFAYGEAVDQLALVVADTPAVAPVLAFAAAPLPGEKRQRSQVVVPAQFEPGQLAETSLLVWQSAEAPAAEDEVRAYVEAGGVIMLIPPGVESRGLFGLTGWAEPQLVPEGTESFAVTAWERREGPLRGAADGTPLGMTDIQIEQRQPMLPGGTILASFDDGIPFLTRRQLAKGAIFECAALPGPGWSTMDDGMVLVPLLQRLLVQGAQRFAPVTQSDCGNDQAGGAALVPLMVSRTDAVANPLTTAGIYQHEEQMIVVQRPASEDEVGVVPEERLAELFEGVKFSSIQERKARAEALQSEVWKIMICGSLLFLALAGLLTLERRVGQNRRGGRTT